jgi:hypothetical protein
MTRPTIVLLVATLVACAPDTVRDVRRAAPIQPIENERPARILVDAPLAAALAQGRVVIQYRAENVHIAPVFGAPALGVSPRIGHIHVVLDDLPWVWADASDEPVVINGLPPGPHEVALELRTANHELLDRESVAFHVPERVAPAHLAAPPHATNEPPARIIIARPAEEPLSRGVAFIRYRTENLHLVPVFGAAAVAISPRVGHVHVTVDDAAWRWLDASGNPVIVSGLAPGPHQIRLDLVDAAHQPLDHGVVDLVIPAKTSTTVHHH